MNFNTHKIRGVEKTVCTAEQMIAYNFSQAYNDRNGDWVACFAKAHMRESKQFDKYNQELIIHLISTCKSKTYFGKIATSYEEVGKFFPIKL